MAHQTIQIQRPHGASWGFRLAGGKDFCADLSIKKVVPGSPAEGYLQAGDQIVAIGNQPAQPLTHAQANGMIKSAGNLIQFTIIRGPSMDFSDIKPSGPVKFQPWKHGQA